MNDKYIKEGVTIIPTNEPLNKQPKFFSGNNNFQCPILGRCIDKIGLFIPQKYIVKSRFLNLKNCKSITTSMKSGYAYLYIHAEHMSPIQPLWMAVHGAAALLLDKGCFQYQAEKGEFQVLEELERVPFVCDPKWYIFLNILSSAKLHEVEIAYDVYEDDINFSLLKECKKMSDELYPDQTYYSPVRRAKAGEGVRLKNKSILVIYDRTKALVDKGKLPPEALLSKHVYRIELRMTSRYIERRIDKSRSVYNQGSCQFMPDFFRLTPIQAVDSLAAFSKRTIKNFIPYDGVWENLNPASDLYKLLFN